MSIKSHLVLNHCEKKLDDNLKFFYVTIGFDSDIEFPNLIKQRIEYQNIYPHFCFYKPEVCLMAMNTFPDEDFIYTDTDVLFSHRFDPLKMKSNFSYPLAGFPEYEYPYIWEKEPDGTVIIYDEAPLLRYFGGTARTQRYVLSCFFLFNRDCKDFMEEWYSMCRNTYLLDRKKIYFPFPDETAFNVCLWKRNVTENLGFVFLNTNDVDLIKRLEEWFFSEGHIREPNKNWLYLTDATGVVLYHGMKDKNDMEETSRYIQNI